MALLPPERFNLLVSEAATLWEVYTYISANGQDDTGVLDGGLRASRTKSFGTSSGIAPLMPDFREFQVRHACDILGAVAFEMYVRTNGPQDAFRDTRSLLKGVVNRLDRAGIVDFFDDKRFSKQDLLEHLGAVFEMDATALKYFIFSESVREVRWTDITTQAFFAAFWACRWADDKDRRMMWNWLPDPLRNTNERYLEFWRFVAEMPREAVNRERFERLLSPLYDGTWTDDDTDLPIRSTELICRSWDRMKDTAAGRVFRGEFRQILAGSGVKAQVANGLLELEVADKSRESQFLSLCRGERGAKDTGRFTMGAPYRENPIWDGSGERKRNPLHPVRLSHYRLHRHCVSNLEYELFDIRHAALQEFSGQVRDEGEHPVVNVTWYDASCFAAWIGEIEVTDERYQVVLPSEAQWEYACRAGKTTPFTWDVDRDGRRIESSYCNFKGNHPWQLSGMPAGRRGVSRNRTVRVDGMDEDGTQIPANVWGFSQMHGNVWEWCGDWYGHNYYRLRGGQEVTDPAGPESGVGRVLRGGSWSFYGRDCRSGHRYWSTTGTHNRYFGFRLAAVPGTAGGE